MQCVNGHELAGGQSECNDCGATSLSRRFCQRGHPAVAHERICRQCGAVVDQQDVRPTAPLARPVTPTTEGRSLRVALRPVAAWLLILGGMALFASVFRPWASDFIGVATLSEFDFIIVMVLGLASLFVGLRLLLASTSALTMVALWVVAFAEGVTIAVLHRQIGPGPYGPVALGSGFYLALGGTLATFLAAVLLQISMVSRD